MLKITDPDETLLLQWVLRMPDLNADEVLVDVTMYEMRKKLATKRQQGMQGWYGPDCTSADLKESLQRHIKKGDMIDVINLAAMIMVRQKLFGDTA